MNQNEPMDKAAKEPEEVRKAKEKAMRLLLQQDRTEKELRDRLYRAGFSETASEAAMQYVSGFGYLDDRRYAENYISFHKGRRSRKEISFKLKEFHRKYFPWRWKDTRQKTNPLPLST